jgi:hypothetical protein
MKDLHIKSFSHNLHEVGPEEAMKVFERQIREEIGEKVKTTQNEFHVKDKRTGEVRYTGSGVCRDCGQRRDKLDVDQVLSLINNKEV